MARTRQQAKLRKQKRLEQERKQAERAQGGGDGGSASREALAEVEQAQLDAARELSEAQSDEVGAGTEAARSAAALEAATAAEAMSTGEVAPPPAPEQPAKPTRRERRTETKPARREPEKKPARQPRAEKKEPRKRGRVVNFLIQVWAELRRVQWPNRNQVTQATTVVIVFCLLAGAYLGILDFLFSKLIKLIL